MSSFEPFKTNLNDSNPLYPGSTASYDPALRELHQPSPPEFCTPPSRSEQPDQLLPMRYYFLLGPPVLGAILSTDSTTPALIRWGWFPALLVAAVFIAWWHFRRAR